MEKKENNEEKCPSHWGLTLFVAGEYSDDRDRMQGHLSRCQKCREAVGRLEQAREEFLERHPPEKALPPLLERARPPARAAWRWAAAAACLVVAVLAVFLLRGEPAERVKGSWSVQVYLLRQGKVTLAESGQVFFPGDRIQFTYTSPTDGYLFLVSVDSGGRVVSFNPDGSEISIDAVAGSEKVVQGSVELDESTGPERVFALFSERPLRLAEIDRVVASDLGRRGGGVENMIRLSLEHPQSSFLMFKRPPLSP